MKRFASVLPLLIAATALAGVEPMTVLTATQSGVSGENLNDTPVTDAIDMHGVGANQLSLTLTVTAGSTTTFTVKCAESETGAADTWAQIGLCDGNASAACAPDIRTYTLSEYTTQGSAKIVSSRWAVKKRYVQCTLTGTGTGTVVVTGTRSWQ